MNSIPAIMTIAATGLLGLVGGGRTGGRSIPQEQSGSGTHPWRIEFDLVRVDWERDREYVNRSPQMRSPDWRHQSFLDHARLIPMLEALMGQQNFKIRNLFSIPHDAPIRISVKRAEKEEWGRLSSISAGSGPRSYSPAPDAPRRIAKIIAALSDDGLMPPGRPFSERGKRLGTKTLPLKVSMEFPSHRGDLQRYFLSPTRLLLDFGMDVRRHNRLKYFGFTQSLDRVPAEDRLQRMLTGYGVRFQQVLVTTSFRSVLDLLGLMAKNFKIYPEKGYPKDKVRER